MVICITIASIILTLSIFAFFGNAFSNTGGNLIPNMFHLMFGGTTTYEGHMIIWKQYGALTFLFVVEILIIVLAIIAFNICYNIKNNYGDEKYGTYISVGLICLAIAASITSLCTLKITNINQNGSYDVKLGFGPIFYSILQMLSIVLLVVGIILNYNEQQSFRRFASRPSSTTYSSQSTVSSSSSKPSFNENEKADLILKYKKMLDEGVITQEEFDKKKKQLLS